jgi:site-specific recombinase XerD
MDGFATWLSTHDYPRSTIRLKLSLVGFLSKWMESEHIDPCALNADIALRCAAARRQLGIGNYGDAHTYRQFIEVARKAGAVPAAPASEPRPVDALLFEYAQFLRRERQLTEVTVSNYVPLVRHFLGERFGDADLDLRSIELGDLTKFLIRLGRTAPGRVDLARSALRSFFRCLVVRGLVSVNVAAGIPRVTRWRQSALPDRLEQSEVCQLLQYYDRKTKVGMRNYAILLLLTRLGLRATETCNLALDDVNWRTGIITVRGKGGREDRLPVQPDVGEALAIYLGQARPTNASRRLFLSARAPRRPLHRAGIGTIVARALRGTGLRTRGSAHLLRHSLATGMMRGGATLAEVGQVLRHQSSAATEIYAKVRIETLRGLSLPWPMVGGEE